VEETTGERREPRRVTHEMGGIICGETERRGEEKRRGEARRGDADAPL
jgi:hypothetical protein